MVLNTTVPAATPPPPAAKEPPPNHASVAFVAAAPESELMAVPVLAVANAPTAAVVAEGTPAKAIDAAKLETTAVPNACEAFMSSCFNACMFTLST